MSSGCGREPPAETRQAGASRRKARRLQTGVRGLIVVVACCAVISWLTRSLWESQHPSAAAARGLRSEDPARRTQATRELMSIGAADPARAIPPLIDALGDPNVEVRIGTIDALGVIGSDGVTSGAAADAIRAASNALTRVLEDREPSVRIAAIVALERIVAARKASGPIDPKAAIDAIAKALSDGDEAVARRTVQALTICGPSYPADLPASLVADLERPSATHRARAIWALVSFRCSLDPWLPLLLRGLERGEPDVRAACWMVFGRDRSPAFSAAAIPALVAALDSRDQVVRARAARALEPHVRDPRAVVAVPGLLDLLEEPIHRDPILRNVSIPDPRNLQPSLVHLVDDDPAMPAIRFFAGRAL